MVCLSSWPLLRSLLLLFLLLIQQEQWCAQAWTAQSFLNPRRSRTRGVLATKAYGETASLSHLSLSSRIRPTLPLAAAASAQSNNDADDFRDSDEDQRKQEDDNGKLNKKRKKKVVNKRKKTNKSNNNKKKTSNKKKKFQSKKKRVSSKKKTNDNATMKSAEERERAKQELVKQVGERMAAVAQQTSKTKRTEPSSQTMAGMTSAGAAAAAAASSSTNDNDDNLLDRLNPFKAGQTLRKTIDTALTTINTNAKTAKDSIYYLDDRLSLSSGAAIDNDKGRLTSYADDDYVPEVLVVNPLSQIGTRVVQRLLRGTQGQFRVRVLVPDLYTETLQRFGTGVTYSPGDLGNIDSLEYAVTDVDKIVFCPALVNNTKKESNGTVEPDWQAQVEARAQRAEAVDCWGMKNVVQAYQDVRHADYGTSQAAKRTLFKFSRSEDFNLFAIMVDDDDNVDNEQEEDSDNSDDTEDEEVDYDDYDPDDDYRGQVEWNHDDDSYTYEQDVLEQQVGVTFASSTTTTQVQWVRNRFDHAVFVGRITPEAQAAVVSSRLRSRDHPDQGIDLSTAFAGFILRVCSDGRTYQAFIRTSSYASHGVEYVCRFSTETKNDRNSKNKSRNKFTTVRLPFDKFRPMEVVTSGSNDDIEDHSDIPEFVGQDVQQIGFRYVAVEETPTVPDSPAAALLATRLELEVQSSSEQQQLQPFYLAFSYIKLYRSQPEPEFVYVSDARVPPLVSSNMVRHDMKRLLLPSGEDDEFSGGAILLEDRVTATDGASATVQTSRSTPEEVYFKYVGEEILKRSGLAFAVVRVQDVLPEEDDTRGAVTEIALAASPTEDGTTGGGTTVSQDQVAQVCVSALLDPNALNKAFYLSSVSAANVREGGLSDQFRAIPKQG